MKLIVKESLNKTKLTVVLSILAAAFGMLSVLVGDIFVGFAAASLAVLLLTNSMRHIPAASVGVLVIVLDLLINGFTSFVGVEMVCIALIIAYLFSRGEKKCFISAIITVLVTLLVLLSFCLLAMKSEGSYTFEAVTSFYTALYESTKDDFVSAMMKMIDTLPDSYSQMVTEITETEISLVFDSLVSGLISVFVIYGFLISGIALKSFAAIASAISDNSREISEWRFSTSNVFCYFYIVLFFAVTFVSDTGTLQIAIENLYTIFMVVYAYIGLRAEYRLLRSRLNPLVCILIIVGEFVMLSFIVMQTLSIFGVLGTLAKNKSSDIPLPPDGNDE